MNKRYVFCIIVMLMLILNGCTLENKAGSKQLYTGYPKVNQNNGTVIQNGKY